MRKLAVIAIVAFCPVTTGCVVGTLVDVATLPARAGAKAVDLATTSQSEADEKRGRELRKNEEMLGRLERDYAKQRDRCERGKEDACEDARATYDQIQRRLARIPPVPER